MSEREIVLKRINVKDCVLEYDFSYTVDLKEYFKYDSKFYVEYKFPLDNIPDAVLAIPFMCSILPIAWILDVKVICDVLDRNFYESIEGVKHGYRKQYPEIDFLGLVEPKKLVNTQLLNHDSHRPVMFFSGGVDASATMIRHLEERPVLFTLWGADLMPEDEDGWKIVCSSNLKTSKMFGLDYTYAKTSFRTFINEVKLHELVRSINAGYGWYHDFSHGIGIISHAAPVTYYYGMDLVYIAASVTENDKDYFGASMPFIDEKIRWADVHVIHDGFHLNRQKKIDLISDYVKKNSKEMSLRVCWETRDGKNCCHCEKCFRTLAGILLSGADPRMFGFDFAPERWPEIISFLKIVNEIDYTWMSVYMKAVQIVTDENDESLFANELIKINLSKWEGNGHTLHNPKCS